MTEILSFLQELAANNNRDWFQEHKAQYQQVKEAFEALTAALISQISTFDESVKYLTPKDCTYRIYRDVRFSPDKSPYKRHFGCFIDARGKKSLHGGYYFHLQPRECMIAGGCWWLPTPILRVIRQTIIERKSEFQAIVEAPNFKDLYPKLTLDPLKVMPRDMPKDFDHPEYLKCRNYCVGHSIEDRIFQENDWIEQVAKQFQVMKPFMDFVNEVVDDYI